MRLARALGGQHGPRRPRGEDECPRVRDVGLADLTRVALGAPVHGRNAWPPNREQQAGVLARA
eukprot:4227947-Pyramimonas_sp.AAC.1